MQEKNAKIYEQLKIIKDKKLKIKIYDYITKFNTQFHTNLEQANIDTPLSLELFKIFFDDIYNNNELRKIYSDIMKEILAKDNHIFIKEQKDLIQCIYECNNLVIDEIIRESYLYGYATARVLNIEIKNRNKI